MILSWLRATALLCLTAHVALAQTPKTDSLPPPKASEESVSEERARLQAQLQDLIRRINERPAISDRPPSALPGKHDVGPAPKNKFEFPDGLKPIDSLRLATNLFRENEVDAALRAFRLIDKSNMGPEDRAFVQYMIGCCYRKMGKRSDAATIFRDLASAKEDEFITECALGQLALIQSAQELESQLEQIRARAKPR